jgi:pyruvate-ferredoxin/flavodoxin oxidoreductase
MICPHAAIQAKVFAPEALAGAPEGFRAEPVSFERGMGLRYTVQVAPEDCTGCGLCVEVCPAKDRLKPQRKALVDEPLAPHRAREREAFAFFEQLPSAPLDALKLDKRSAVLRPPLFEFSGACAGCGETPYIKLLTQLFGDHLLIANATGCSSIYGGNLPTTPYTTDATAAARRGPTRCSRTTPSSGSACGWGRRAPRPRPGAARGLGATARVSWSTRCSRPARTTRRVAAQRERVATLRDGARGDPSPEARALRALAAALVPQERVDRRRRRLGLRHRLRRPRPRARRTAT